MRRRSSLAIVWLILLALSLIITGIFSSSSAVAAEQVGNSPPPSWLDISERIARVESGLLPPVLIQGGPPAAMTLAERMSHYNIPGVSIAVINNGEIEWARGYGVRENGGNAPITTTTLFQAGSISKPVAAMAALFLVQQGNLELDEHVNIKLVSWQLPENEYTTGQKVSLRGILSHTAGLTVRGFPGYAANEEIPTLLQVLDGIEPANTMPIRVDMTPHSQWRYSGGGYTVMQQLLIDIAGKPFPNILEEVVLRVIGMKHSTFQQPLPQALAASAATAHRKGRKIKGKWHTYPEMAAAGLWTTPSDLALFAIELQNAISGISNKMFSTSMANLMVTAKMQNYGLGLALKGEGKAVRFSHGGVNEGFEASIVAYTSTRQGAVVMANGSGGMYLVQEIIRGIAREYSWIDFLGEKKVLAQVDSKLYEAYVGQYELDPNLILSVSKKGDRLYARATDQRQFEIFPESEITFFPQEFDAQITFIKDEMGRVTHLVLRQHGEHSAKKIK
jgi:CubicO group peptidase (beta-lactamase class C family)